uniref:Bm5025 n=1 Tax=Brugia malayi TaxID=6279 RepID=A0A0H5S863_BRUMA|nr:Bm5025 [Brugia malayi]
MTRSIAHTRNTHFFDLIHFGMVTSRWIRMIRVARSYPRWLWNNWPTHFVGVVFCFVPMTVIVIYDIFKYGSGYNSMPYYRKYYHVVRPDDPIVLEWRPPEDVYKGSHFLHISNAEYSFLDVTEILAWVNILFFWLYIICITTRATQYIQNDVRNGTRWIYVEFFECPSVLKINVNTIRAALARWINEECATAIQCNLVSAVEVKNVLVGTIFCGTPNNFITFLVLRNATTYAFLQANHLDLNIVGKVIQSREHLLSALLHSDLKLVTTRVFNEETSGASRSCLATIEYMI